MFGLLERLGTAGNLTADAHLAALAIEYQAELHSTDADFSRFSGLRWRNPLK
jgi:predicted nucleic acid-binding protein